MYFFSKFLKNYQIYLFRVGMPQISIIDLQDDSDTKNYIDAEQNDKKEAIKNQRPAYRGIISGR